MSDNESEIKAQNMRIWDRVDTTAPGFTTTTEFQGRQITSIAGTYMLKKATEIFGPLGVNWGYEIINSEFLDGAPLLKDGQIVGCEKTHTLLVELWYQLPDMDERASLQQFGHTPFIYYTYNGPRTDHEVCKKSLTDAIKKCLSQIGFCADVFLGLFDDEEYVEIREIEEKIANSDNQEEAQEEAIADLNKWVAERCKMYLQLTNMITLKRRYEADYISIQDRCRAIKVDPKPGLEKLDAAFAEAEKIVTEARERLDATNRKYDEQEKSQNEK